MSEMYAGYKMGLPPAFATWSHLIYCLSFLICKLGCGGGPGGLTCGQLWNAVDGSQPPPHGPTEGSLTSSLPLNTLSQFLFSEKCPPTFFSHLSALSS